MPIKRHDIFPYHRIDCRFSLWRGCLLSRPEKRGLGKWGFNINSVRDVSEGKPLLKNVFCPRCGSEQPSIRKPTNLDETFLGGWTCSSCGARMDKWGNIKRQ